MNFSGYSQVYPYLNYSVRQGLVNSNVYAMTQDPTGYIWLGTENGLSRFDGINFKNYTLEKLGLKSYISSMVATEDGKIIFGSSGSGIHSFNPITEKLTRISKKALLRTNKLIIKNDLLISLHENRGFDFISIKSGEFVFNDKVIEKNCDNKALSIIKLFNNKIYIGRRDGLYQLNGEEQNKIAISGLSNLPLYSLCEDKNSLIVGSDGIILRIENNKVTDTLLTIDGEKKMVRNIQIDNRGNLWFNVWGLKDLYMLSGKTLINISESSGILNGTITEILMESSGAIFASGLGKGIYLFYNTHLLVYPESENLPNANIQKIISTQNKGLLLGTDDGLAYLDIKGNKISSVKHIPEKKYYVRDITSAPGNQFLIATIDNKFANSFSQIFDYTNEHLKIRYSHCSSIWADSTSVLIGNWDNKLIQYQLPNFKYIISKDNICMERDLFDRLWIGSQKGLCVINREGEKFYPNGLFQEEEIYKINKLRDGNLLIVSNSGFYFLKNNKDERLIKEAQRIAIQGTNCVAITGMNEYLVGTSYGLLFIKDQKKTLMTIQDGILSENINDIYFEDGSSVAWIATSEGLMQVDLDALRIKNSAPLQIRQVVINKDRKSWFPLNINTFKYNSSSFSINFQAFHYHNPQKIKYQYKVDEAGWLPSSNEIQFASLEDGSHTISLRAGLTEGNWGPAKIVNIYVLPPFYKTWWFHTISAMIGLMILMAIVRWQIRIFKKKQEEKVKIQQKLVELQQKALASNLNPHFVFNSLNAIQHFINSKSPEEANEYLAKFARLMRMHLNMAEKSAILLHEEIQRLEFYLSLEQMRFDDKMEWSIHLDPSLDPYHLEIPNMIIQPFVENAIWHGIMPSDQKGFITLNIQPAANEGILITVTDNGVGFNHQPKVATIEHESKGTRLIKERLLLLDSNAANVLRFDHLTPGTMVAITLSSKMYRNTALEVPVS